MLYIKVPESLGVRKLSFYLALEEYVARSGKAGECLFIWQVSPSVIFGRHQVLEQEVNVDFCRRHDIQLFRRKSGGGCVYADLSNIMLSYVTSTGQVGLAFNSFVNMLLLVLRKLGVQAVGTAHNDIMIGDRKVSGTACYHVAGKSIVHGTLLYDTNMDYMTGALTPSASKLRSKGISSVRQRVTFLKDHTPLSIDEVKSVIRQTLCQDELLLADQDIAAVEAIEQTYLREQFIYQL